MRSIQTVPIFMVLSIAASLTMPVNAAQAVDVSDGPQVLSAVRGEFFHDKTAMRTFVLLNDGSFNVTDRENGLVTRMSVNIIDNRATIVMTTPWGVSTRVIDLTEAEQFMRSNPNAAKAADTSLNQLTSQERLTELDQVVVNPLVAGPCATEAQAMSTAASAMYTACKSGSPDACASATITYVQANNAYNVCMPKARNNLNS
jgi:hypothetical protein